MERAHAIHTQLFMNSLIYIRAHTTINYRCTTSHSFQQHYPWLSIGAFAFLLPRLENAYLHRDIARGNAEMPPSFYTDRFSVDSAVFGVGALNLLVETMGEDRVMLGSDYPFPLGEQQVGKVIRDAHTQGKYDEGVRNKLLGGNAINFFDLKKSSAKF